MKKGEEIFTNYGEKYWTDKIEKIIPSPTQFSQNIEELLLKHKGITEKLEDYEDKIQKLTKKLNILTRKLNSK